MIDAAPRVASPGDSLREAPMNMQSPVPRPLKAPRDPRLDFFRGIGMFIIFIAHVRDNTWTLWIPARFGFSDATEMFVFCSGMASAIAFGRSFDQAGWLIGTARVSQRIWQVYFAHICQFLLIASALVALQTSGLLKTWFDLSFDVVGALNLWLLFERTQQALPGLFTLTYVPNYFDILPMYVVILAMMPVVMALARVGRAAVFSAMVAMWLAAEFGWLDLPAEPWSDRSWFFNPFAWQLLFFTGFALMRGWLPAPPVRRDLVLLALAIVLVSVPLAWYRIYETVPALLQLRMALEPLWMKTGFGLLRYVHFLALAYLAWVAVGDGGRYLLAGGWVGRAVAVVQKVGQQSLAVFLASLAVAQAAGIARDAAGGSGLLVDLVMNLGGIATLVAVAYLVAWYKSEPWRRVSGIGVSQSHKVNSH